MEEELPQLEAARSVVFDAAEWASDKFQRNNKRGGLKNLRCFPSCAEAGHSERGFCGRPVLAALRAEDAPLLRGAEDAITARGEFVEATTTPTFTVGQRVSFDERVWGQTRSRALPRLPFVEGVRVSVEGHRASDVALFEFNRERNGWHHEWKSTKHTCDARHVFRVYVFKRDGANAVCVGIGDSPSFVVFCRRRRRYATTPVARREPPKPRTSSGGRKRPSAARAEVEKKLRAKRVRVSAALRRMVGGAPDDYASSVDTENFSVSSVASSSAPSSVASESAAAEGLLQLLRHGDIHQV